MNDLSATSPFSSIPSHVAARFDVAVEDGVTLAAYALHDGPADGPALVWAHANGFSAGSYLPFLERLAARFRVFAYDVRGHGGSSMPPAPIAEALTFDRFARDLETVTYRVLEQTGGAPVFFAGHSFSAAAMFHLGGNFGFAPWRAVTTFDATLLPNDAPAVLAARADDGSERIARTLRRRRYWRDHAAYEAAMGRPGVFDTWDKAMLRAHCQATILPRRDGEAGPEAPWELACPPEVEATIYANVATDLPYGALPNFPVPTHLLAADPAAGGTWVGLVQHEAARHLPNARLTVASDAGHLIPMEKPDESASFVMEMLDA